MWNLFLVSNTTKYRLIRTIVQGIIGVVIANIDLIISTLNFGAETKAIIVALVMAILSPIMKALGTEDITDNADDEELIYSDEKEV